MNGNVFNLHDSNLPPVWDSNIPKLLEPYSINIVSGKKKMCTDHLLTPNNHHSRRGLNIMIILKFRDDQTGNLSK